MERQTLLILIITGIGLLTLVGVLCKMKGGFGSNNLRVYGLTLIIIVGALLALSDIGTEKLLPSFSILSGIAGYLFGLKNPKGNNGENSSTPKT
jgi:hypothetical protein